MLSTFRISQNPSVYVCVTHYLYLLQFYLILGQFGLCYEKVINLTGLFQLITSKRIKSFTCLTRINNWQLIWLIFLLKHHLWYIPPVCCCETVFWNINLQRTLYLYHLSKEHCCWSPHSQDHLCYCCCPTLRPQETFLSPKTFT